LEDDNMLDLVGVQQEIECATPSRGATAQGERRWRCRSGRKGEGGTEGDIGERGLGEGAGAASDGEIEAREDAGGAAAASERENGGREESNGDGNNGGVAVA
jgi:hypothetical protein